MLPKRKFRVWGRHLFAKRENHSKRIAFCLKQESLGFGGATSRSEKEEGLGYLLSKAEQRKSAHPW